MEKGRCFQKAAVIIPPLQQERPCFLVTKEGCTVLSSRSSWEKGRILIRAYLEAFDGFSAKLADKNASIKEKVEALGDAMHLDKKTVQTILKAVEKTRKGKGA